MQHGVRPGTCPQGVTAREKRVVKDILLIIYLVIGTLTDKNLMCFRYREVAHFLG